MWYPKAGKNLAVPGWEIKKKEEEEDHMPRILKRDTVKRS